MDRISWPTIIITGFVLLVVGYFVGQGLHLDRKTPSAAPAAVTVTVSQPYTA